MYFRRASDAATQTNQIEQEEDEESQSQLRE
jgi:hypothetical protein